MEVVFSSRLKPWMFDALQVERDRLEYEQTMEEVSKKATYIEIELALQSFFNNIRRK